MENWIGTDGGDWNSTSANPRFRLSEMSRGTEIPNVEML
jgi:hypothetical protein